MKKTKALTVLSVCVLLACAAVFLLTAGDRPFKDLDTAEIASADVHLIPPDKTVQITDTEELAEYLKDIVIYREDSSYTEYDGQGVTFTLTMQDGTQIEAAAYQPFFILNGVGYRTSYEPCETLSNYANRLLNAEDAVILLKEPPTLTVVSDNTACGALLGRYQWQQTDSAGNTVSLLSESPHPLGQKDKLVRLDTSQTTALLQFPKEPDAILSIRCWSDEHWGDLSADSESVAVYGNEIELKPGGYIYEVQAQWDVVSGYGGTACYSFYIKAE